MHGPPLTSRNVKRLCPSPLTRGMTRESLPSHWTRNNVFHIDIVLIVSRATNGDFCSATGISFAHHNYPPQSTPLPCQVACSIDAAPVPVFEYHHSDRRPTMAALSLFFVLALPLLARAETNGMDMSMDDGMTLANSTMLPMLHFILGDTLWFEGWVPQSKGALAGACIGLLILALVDRWLAAVRAMMEVHWRAAAARIQRARRAEDKKTRRAGFRLQATPFIPAHDVLRGVIHAVQVLLGFAFMLAVMTFQAAYIITLILGLGLGEMLFGRYAAGAAAGH